MNKNYCLLVPVLAGTLLIASGCQSTGNGLMPIAMWRPTSNKTFKYAQPAGLATSTTENTATSQMYASASQTRFGPKLA